MSHLRANVRARSPAWHGEARRHRSRARAFLHATHVPLSGGRGQSVLQAQLSRVAVKLSSHH
eukprot:15039543-Alexandrium_andersonii.AAC.1